MRGQALAFGCGWSAGFLFMPSVSFFLAKGVSQVASKDLLRYDGQGELALARRAEPNEVPEEMIQRQKTGAAALCLACQSSGLEDKEIYSALKIDAGYFSRMKKGEASLQADQVQPFCEVVGNLIYVQWQAYQVGCKLVLIKSEAERRAEHAEERLRAVDAENKLMRQLLQGRAVVA